MAQHSAWKKALLTTLVFSMISSGAAFADESDTASDPTLQQSEQPITAVRPSTPFSDVKNGHWAEKHIAKLNLQGIVQGYQGKFRPADNVTQQEAVVMALRFMGLADSVNTSDAVILPSAFTVNESYKAYVAAALQHNLLDQDEAAAEGEGEAAWGSKPATREWITKLAVRAIGQQKLALEMDGSRAAFIDANQISEGFAGYVNAATSLELVKGITPDKFDPKGLINRAQLATLFSRAESQHNVTYKGQVSGIVTMLSDSAITLYGDNGRNTTYAITPETLLYRYDSEQAVQLSELTPYTNATVIAGNGNALYIEQTSSEQQVETIEGTLVSVDRDNGLLYVKVGSGVPSIPFDSSLVVADGSGNAIELSALVEGSTLRIMRETFRAEKTAVKVELKGAPVNKTGTGTITEISSGRLTINDAADGEQQWNIAPAAVIMNKTAPATLADVRVGDKVTYTVENDLVVGITIDTTAGQVVTGQFDAVGADYKSMTYLVNGQLKANFIAPTATLTIEGITSPSWSDLVQEDQLELTLNGNQQITAVKVTNRNVQTFNGATISIYDPDSKTIVLTDTNGKAIFGTLSAKTRIEMNGSLIPLENAARNNMLAKNRKVSITLSDTTVVSVRFIYKYSGTLMMLNGVTNQMTLKLPDDSTVTLPYTTPIVEIHGKSSTSLNDVKTGDGVTVLLDSNQDKVLAIQVHHQAQQRITSVDANAGKIKLVSSTGSVTDYSVGADWTLQDENNNKLTLSQLAAGQYVNVTFAGNTPVALQRVHVTYGKVAGSSSSAITVTDLNGRTTDFALGSGYSVVRNGVASGSAASLAAGERVEVRKDEQGRVVVTVITGVSKTFWRYDAQSKVLYAVRLTNENNTFTVVPETVVTAGDAIVDITALKFNDPITVYQKDGVLLEVAKQ